MDGSLVLESLIGQVVVLDLESPYVVMGTFRGTEGPYCILEDADMHDLRNTATTRDLYVLDAKRHGVNCNRRPVSCRRRHRGNFSPGGRDRLRPRKIAKTACRWPRRAQLLESPPAVNNPERRSTPQQLFFWDTQNAPGHDQEKDGQGFRIHQDRIGYGLVLPLLQC